MTTILSDFAKRVRNTVNGDCAGDLVVNQFFIDLAAGDLALNNVIDLGVLPAGHTVINANLIPDDLDTSGAPAITLDVGIMTGVVGDGVNARTVGTELFSQSTAAQAGTPTAASAKSAFTIPAVGYDRSIGVAIHAAPATAAAGRIRLNVTMAPVNSGFAF